MSGASPRDAGGAGFGKRPVTAAGGRWTREKLLLAFVTSWSVAATAFHLYSTAIGYFEPRTQRSIHLLFMLPLIFLIRPALKRNNADNAAHVPGWTGLALFALATMPFLYSWWQVDRINLRLEGIDPVLPAELAMGTIATLLMVEALRRAVSPILAGMVAVGVAYLFLTEWMYGLFHYRNIEFAEIVETMYLFNGQGIFGSITGIASTMVAIFIAFGAFMQASGVGRLFSRGGELLAGRYAGGPAKVSVITSAFFGSMSGSASSNVFTTGSFTIPMMKRTGYRPEVAGGIETAASVGGQSAPPIMGAGAFIMSEITGIPYTDIIIAALLGAVCYFSLIMISVHLEAKKNGLKGMSEEELPKLPEVARDLFLLVPIGVLITMLVLRYSPHWSAFCSIVATVVVACSVKRTRLSASQFVALFDTAGRNTAPIAVACAGAAMLVAVLTKTGLVVSFSAMISDISAGYLWGAGLALMLMTLMMGMGVPTTPAYVITAAIGAPLLINEFGVPVLAAHLFIFYFAILADATPPVSIASYAAAGIAKSHPLATGLQACRMALAGYCVGFSYLFVPELRMEGTVLSVLGNLVCIIGGLSLLAGAFAGYLCMRLNALLRIVLACLGLGVALYIDLNPFARCAIALAALSGMWLWARASRDVAPDDP